MAKKAAKMIKTSGKRAMGIVTILRNGFANLIFLGFVIFIAMNYFQHIKEVSKHGILELKPEGAIVEQISLDPQGRQPKQVNVWGYANMLAKASEDSRIHAVILNVDKIEPSGITALSLFRRAIIEFKKSGKEIIVYSNRLTQTGYYLASAASKVIMGRLGTIHLEGLGFYSQYYADAAQWVGVDIIAYKAGKYKSAVETYVRSDMSPATKENLTLVLNREWETMLSHMQDSRGFDAEALKRVINMDGYGGVLTASKAKKLGLIDNIQSKKEFDEDMAAIIHDEDGQYPKIRESSYASNINANKEPILSILKADYSERIKEDQPVIAVYEMSGPVEEGEGYPGKIAAESNIKVLREIRKAPNLKVLVLRINTPGGSVIASEQIRSELQKFKDDGIKIIVSMGGMCASGGYWISSISDYLIAEDTTITGSIGVFGLHLSVADLLQKIHIHTDGVGTGPATGAGRFDMPQNPHFNAQMQSIVGDIYKEFTSIVVGSRKDKLTRPINKIAEGRIWDAISAVDIGLIDEIGGLQDAIRKAADIADLKQFNIMVAHQKVPLMMRLRSEIMKEMNFLGQQQGIQGKVWDRLDTLIRQNNQVLAVAPTLKSEATIQ